MSRSKPWIALCLLVGACAENGAKPAEAPVDGQSYVQAIAMICNVDREVGIDAQANVLEIAERRHDYLHERVKNPDGIYYYTIFRTQDPKQQAESLRHEAREQKLKGCALADSLESEG